MTVSNCDLLGWRWWSPGPGGGRGGGEQSSDSIRMKVKPVGFADWRGQG